MPCFGPVALPPSDGKVFLFAFDLIELDGDDLRREPIERRKVLLNRIARQGERRAASERPHHRAG
jgi:ATP-dependent DNA ligase